MGHIRQFFASITMQRAPGTREAMGGSSQGRVRESWVSDYNPRGGTPKDRDVHVCFVPLETKFIGRKCFIGIAGRRNDYFCLRTILHPQDTPPFMK